MQCPKCKKEIKNNSLKCEYCGSKIGTLCKKCGKYNPINAIKCSSCNEPLLKICTECNSANLPNAKKCRKCGIEFINEQVKANINTNSDNLNTQQTVKLKLIEAIKNVDSKIITLSGESGIGKNLIIRMVANELKNAKIIWLLGACTQLTQLSPMGYFQDLLLSFFNINNFCPDTLQFKKNSIRFFKQDFPSLTNKEILDLLNFLYPNELDRYENLYQNKAKTFAILKKVIYTILDKTKVIFVIDKVEYIDGMSFDFLQELLNDEYVLQKCKFILTTSNQKPGLGIITSKNLLESNYTDLNIAKFNNIQIETFFKQYKDFKFGKDFINLSAKVSQGNPSILEQIVLAQYDQNSENPQKITFDSLENLIKYRLNYLKETDIKSYRLLIAMSVLGLKFYPAILDSFDNNSPKEFERIIETLVHKGFITQLNSIAFKFKSQILWENIVSLTKNDECFEEILNILYEIITIYNQSSIALLGYIVQKLNNNDQAFEIWTHLMKQACYIGDIGLYIITQKQALKLIENKAGAFYQKVKKNIYTRLGKILEPIEHTIAFEYLQKSIMMLDDNEDFTHIELLGYLASCSIKMGNYWGAIECVDNVLSKLPENMHTEKNIIKCRQINPLLKLGNYGQVINLIEAEILNEIEPLIKKGRNTNIIKIKDLFDTWISIYFDYAEALVFQGNNKSYEIIDLIYEVLDVNKITNPTYICKAHLLLALANTMKGDIKQSNKILDDILKEYSLDSMDSFIISRWNLIDILNKFFLKDYMTLHNELFNVVAYANNVNDSFTKNILKTLLAKILKDSNQTKKALEILEEQVAYFAKEKISTGVLLSWYLIAKIKLITNGTQFALDIATKASDIAQSPSINNYYFIALFNKLIGEIYLAKQDFESAKVYLEKSIMIAKQFDMQYILAKTYLQCAKLYQELALPKTSNRILYIKQALKMFQLAKNVPIVAEQTALQKTIKEDLNILTSFCKLNGIVLKKENK